MIHSLSPKSKQQILSDIEAHGGKNNFLYSINFYKEQLSMQTTPFWSARKQAYRAVIDKIRADGQRTIMLEWLLSVAIQYKISDEAFFHGVHLAENALVSFHQKQ